MADTDLRLYAGVPLTRDNLDFIDTFTSESTQLTAFEPFKIKHYTDISEIRKSESDIIVRSIIDEVETANYMSFKNGSGKRYYCYITNVVYDSEEGSKVTFEIDYMTTWLLALVTKDCMIEREHTLTDVIGEHLVDEGLPTGEYILRASDTLTTLNELAILVSTSKVPDGAGGLEDAIGRKYSNIYSGTGLVAFENTGAGILALNLFIVDITAKQSAESIVAIFMIPKNLLPSFTNGEAIEVDNSLTIDFNYAKNTTDIDSYTPKNKKLFVYPYNLLYVTNHNGATAEFRYEYSSVSNMQFYATCNVSANPIVALVPKSYKGVAFNFDEILRIADYPQCSWTIDSFLNYLSQNVVNASSSMISGAIGSVTTSNPASFVSATTGVVSGAIQASLQPNQSKGSISGGSNTGIGVQTFGFYPKTIREEYAKIIDGTFTKFGYKVNRLGIPNLKGRPKFNYIKTIDCNYRGLIPSRDLEEIRNIFNSGVTFWHTTDVGNYDLVNTP